MQATRFFTELSLYVPAQASSASRIPRRDDHQQVVVICLDRAQQLPARDICAVVICFSRRLGHRAEYSWANGEQASS